MNVSAHLMQKQELGAAVQIVLFQHFKSLSAPASEIIKQKKSARGKYKIKSFILVVVIMQTKI